MESREACNLLHHKNKIIALPFGGKAFCVTGCVLLERKQKKQITVKVSLEVTKENKRERCSLRC